MEVLKEVQRARDMAELLEWAVEAVSTADKDTLCSSQCMRRRRRAWT